jgi:hypothetical protein
MSKEGEKDKIFSFNFTEFKENYELMRDSQFYLSTVNYKSKFNQQREFIIKYLQFLSKKFCLKNETYFKSVQIFDTYINNIKHIGSTEELRMISIICLNIACKYEEINCNYLIYFKEKLIDNSTKIFSVKEMVDIEIEILKTLKFRINSPGFFYFNTLFLQLALNEIRYKNEEVIKNRIDGDQIIFKLVHFNEVITKNYTNFYDNIFVTPVTAGLICFKASIIFLSYLFSENLIFKSIETSINNKLISLIPDTEYLKKIDLEAFLIFTKLTKNSL